MPHKILCLDYGERYAGVAIADLGDGIALRHTTIDQRQDSVLSKIKDIVEQESVEKILVSVPRSLLGGQTGQTAVSLGFMERLKRQFKDLAVEAVDELFSSKEARRRLRAEGGSLEEEHAEAARLMLEDYLSQKTGRQIA